jgi:hypothetical protein
MNSLIAIEKILAKFLRPAMRSSVSAVRISQSGFERMVSDLSATFSPQEIKYVPSKDISFLLLNHLHVQLPRIVVSGGSDYDVTLKDFELMSEVKSTLFYVQNLGFLENKNIKSLPIGIEDLRWAKNGMPWNFGRRKYGMKKIDQVLVGPFGFTHKERIKCLEAASRTENCVVIFDRLPHWIYARRAAKYKFIACPRGNGLDTHRFWESLYRGSIPVVLESPWARVMKSYGLPIVIISSWTELSKVTEHNLDVDCEHSFDILSPLWWKQRFLADLKS